MTYGITHPKSVFGQEWGDLKVFMGESELFIFSCNAAVASPS